MIEKRLTQVTLQVPSSLVTRAKELAKKKAVREDGLKQTPTSVMRAWLMRGAQNEK